MCVCELRVDLGQLSISVYINNEISSTSIYFKQQQFRKGKETRKKLENTDAYSSVCDCVCRFSSHYYVSILKEKKKKYPQQQLLLLLNI